MLKWQKDLVIIGGGPAGLAAACAAKDSGVCDLVVLERHSELGGILNQCIHNGFGLHYFKEELTGPEYAERFIDEVREKEIPYLTDCMVISLSNDKKITIASQEHGLVEIEAKAVILAMGCRERTRAAITIPGTRPSGVYSAGTVQSMINIEGLMPGKKVVIVGSGDIGLIMARRLTLEGAKVLAVVEIMDYPGGLNRNIAQCLEDFDIPLYLSHTVADIQGKDRVESVLVAPVDEKRQPVLDKAFTLECDTLILSVGLIPENELSTEAGVEIDPVTSGPIVTESLETTVPGIFACGNVLQVHDLVDNVTNESLRAGKMAANYIKNGCLKPCDIKTKADLNVRYVVPQRISQEEDVEFFLRASRPLDRVTLVVGDDLYTKRMRDAKPGEMISVKIPKEKLQNLVDKELTFSIREGK
ncbi:MAG: FAD-dependent oxidoreductase [Firmicutes bacterium]|nr:FAD-dependent oxidoreductase [Bacillota bacterium]MDD4262895.1 FAD-dependent oxidoreductase [Bacillota bacterium]MDD4693040.1 FAD-dependent oxidoreductase [Bacillota bacterium]